MANTCVITRDAENQELTLKVFDAAGAEAGTYGKVVLKIALEEAGNPSSPGHSMGKIIKFRETKGCDAGGNPVYCMVLRSEWYATALTADPET